MTKSRFEHRDAPLAPPAVFVSRMVRAGLASFALVALTLAVGVAGFHWIEEMPVIDAFHHASMLLAGMGPILPMAKTAGKVFDSIYALFCGVVLLASVAVLFAPIVHRLLHRFHLEDGDS